MFKKVFGTALSSISWIIYSFAFFAGTVYKWVVVIPLSGILLLFWKAMNVFQFVCYIPVCKYGISFNDEEDRKLLDLVYDQTIDDLKTKRVLPLIDWLYKDFYKLSRL